MRIVTNEFLKELSDKIAEKVKKEQEQQPQPVEEMLSVTTVTDADGKEHYLTDKQESARCLKLNLTFNEVQQITKVEAEGQ